MRESRQPWNAIPWSMGWAYMFKRQRSYFTVRSSESSVLLCGVSLLSGARCLFKILSFRRDALPGGGCYREQTAPETPSPRLLLFFPLKSEDEIFGGLFEGPLYDCSVRYEYGRQSDGREGYANQKFLPRRRELITLA